MSEAPARPRSGQAGRSPRPEAEHFAALDLGTNNCRLLIATPADGGFRVVEAFSRIVRLGEGLTHTGRLQPEAMDRAVAALRICAEKIRRRRVARLKAVATAACRSAVNGPEFVRRVEEETGLKLTIIGPDEEARLAVAGCRNLLDREAEAALVVDVGGGSTELSWVALTPGRDGRPRTDIKAWLSIAVGVVSLAERFPEPDEDQDLWWRAMVDSVKAEISAFEGAEAVRSMFADGRAHLVGTSGAITSLAGMHLGLQRYDRNRVDGLWLTHADCQAAAGKLMDMGRTGRAAEPCIGPDRADLVLAGAAILEAVQELWPCQRVRVADRGLREGMLLSLMKDRNRKRRRKRRRGPAKVS
ncbi:Ppx/GppA phosphatase family protein [Caulobacter sp. 17J80-11]|uniref:Ppx/GppA phosphatase family protein n=1 Tax=Caulobacter sp. 17J80-11 TaxID=2763502 RepID=UPI00165374B8|nr:Ppx/GppA phosphatase family protein [Caulobacter sp. 17J80-11]MBC6981203.1 Ppx/GppA family phosphatase [Caulobacter sp. 17J80-11]